MKLLLLSILASCLSGCAGYTIGGGLGYTTEDGARYDANVTVHKDDKVVKPLAK